MALTLRTYDSFAQLETLRPAWDELLSNYPPTTTFSTWEWLSSWWQTFGRNRQMLVLALFDSAKLVGLAPLSISTERIRSLSFRALRLLGDGSNDSDNLDMPVLPAWERCFAEYILRYLREQRRHWDLCFLNTMPTTSTTGSALASLLKSSEWTFFDYSSKSSSVELPETWDRYSQMLAAEDRKNLVRYTQRLQKRYGTRIYRCSRASELPDCLNALFNLHQERWLSVGQPGTFSSFERRKFYTELSQQLLAKQWLELWVLELDARIAAVQFAFRYRDRVFQLQEGYDHRRPSDRLGFVLRGGVLKQLIAEKVRVYDFLGGEDSYKTRWAAREGRYRQLHFAPRLGIGGVWLRFADDARRGKEWLRRTLPAPAWNVLHKLNAIGPRTPHVQTSGSSDIGEEVKEHSARVAS